MIEDNLSFMESVMSSFETEDDENHPFYNADEEYEDGHFRQSDNQYED